MQASNVMARREIDASTIDMTLARWDAGGIAETPEEALMVLQAVTGQGICLLCCYDVHVIAKKNPFLMHTHNHFAGTWARTVMTVGDVVKLYVASDVLGVDIDKPSTIYNIGVQLVTPLNRFVLCLFAL